MEKFQTQIGAEVKRFEELATDQRYSKQRRERWKKDLEDGRVLLRAADNIVFQLQNIRDNLESAGSTAKDSEKVEQQNAESNTRLVEQQAVSVVGKEEQQDSHSTRKEKIDEASSSSSEEKKKDEDDETRVVDKEKAAKSREGGLDSDQS